MTCRERIEIEPGTHFSDRERWEPNGEKAFELVESGAVVDLGSGSQRSAELGDERRLPRNQGQGRARLMRGAANATFWARVELKLQVRD